MLWLYNFGIFLYNLVVKSIAPYNSKAKLFNQGRRHLFSVLEEKIPKGQKHVWFHFASLGEFEQGRPVLEKIKALYPHKKIIITFFSPSGYEVRKNYALADGIFYLPLDTASNARRFIEIVNPEIAIFTKYEFWHHYFKILKEKNIPLFLISGIFRPNQMFFKWYGGFYRNMLHCVTWFFVQNQESVHLLQQIGLQNVELSGDTRFDRVYENAEAVKSLPLIEEFISRSPVLLAGSTWPADENLLAQLCLKHPSWKFILAPHEIGLDHIRQIEKQFPSAVRYSALQNSSADSRVLIIDNIGLLSALYQYGTVAYIGGGFGAGIHNTLEAAAFGLPVIFGPRYEKFQEAKDLVARKAAISIHNEQELETAFRHLSSHPALGQIAKDYVKEKKGATEGILKEISKYLN
ncbi:3-deoxy-D-manno-octulosonic acid transferase [Pedobacter sp.]|jgi:3-deoxy-D-manno-octulosonic-acid transferase|uniref:3-deoxy-D-manno-octulosonic acid transferase n=1 Tax=Pedobacter sp. TaxID=1411316 RepID=UPI002B95242E|nr:glycosyltransferase N-terminal domain-containing protein [Pedobacter sp.]HWW41254.1 glycosyltransferase N-terminal domain-containing protein [Pedobacter sp.]